MLVYQRVPHGTPKSYSFSLYPPVSSNVVSWEIHKKNMGLSIGTSRNKNSINSVPSGYVKIAIENLPFIVDLPIQNGDFQ